MKCFNLKKKNNESLMVRVLFPISQTFCFLCKGKTEEKNQS